MIGEIGEITEEKYNAWLDKQKIIEESHISLLEKQYGSFWTGPYDIRIPWRVRCVISSDSVNTLEWYYDSSDKKWFTMSTKLGVRKPAMTREAYLRKYGVRGKDGFWYWRDTYDGPLYEHRSLTGWIKSLFNFSI
jgi:hypothetical protein